MAGNRIRELREARGLSLQALADRVGTSPQQLNRLELGQRALTEDWMRAIAEAMGVSPPSLFPEFAPTSLVVAENEQEASLLRQWRLMPIEDREHVAHTFRLILGKRRGKKGHTRASAAGD